MLTLDAAERAWLDEYRDALKARHPGAVVRMTIYGSKARGDTCEENDLDVLLVVRDGAWPLERPLRDIGYELAATSDAVPSIFAYTQEEWEDRKRRGFPFPKAVEHDGVSIL